MLPLVRWRSPVWRLHDSAADGGEGHPFAPCAVTPFLTLSLTLLFLPEVTPDGRSALLCTVLGDIPVDIQGTERCCLKYRQTSVGMGRECQQKPPGAQEKKSERWQKEQRKRHQGKNGPAERGQRGRKEGHLRKEGGAGDMREQPPAETVRCSGKVQTCKDITTGSSAPRCPHTPEQKSQPSRKQRAEEKQTAPSLR